MNKPDMTLRDYIWTYYLYIVPSCIFPIYFIVWGLVISKKKTIDAILSFKMMVLPVFFIVYFWAAIPWIRGKIPYWKQVLLTMIIPFFIFTVIGIFLSVFWNFSKC